MRRHRVFYSKDGTVGVKLGNYYDDFYESGEFYEVDVFINDSELPYERVRKETEFEAVNVFRDLCEKYRPKRNKEDKDGETIKYLRELGFNAKQTRDSCSGVRDGIAIRFLRTDGKEDIKTYSPNGLIGTPKDIAKAIGNHLVRCCFADIEKGREFYGIK